MADLCFCKTTYMFFSPTCGCWSTSALLKVTYVFFPSRYFFALHETNVFSGQSMCYFQASYMVFSTMFVFLKTTFELF